MPDKRKHAFAKFVSQTERLEMAQDLTKWLKSKNNEHLVSFKTQAWLNGKKHTVSEPVLVKNGKNNAR